MRSLQEQVLLVRKQAAAREPERQEGKAAGAAPGSPGVPLRAAAWLTGNIVVL